MKQRLATHLLVAAVLVAVSPSAGAADDADPDIAPYVGRDLPNIVFILPDQWVGHAMGALGDASGAPIVDAPLRLAGDLAARFSGSAKPCGAGGGDVAVAFFADPAAADAFELACKEEGLHPIDVSWGAVGVKAH